MKVYTNLYRVTGSMFIHKICQALQNAKIPYAIVGGYAVALHGAPRGTLDVDLVILWSLKNLQKAEHALKSLGLVSRLPIDAQSLFDFRDEYVQKRNLIAWNFYHPSHPEQQVDIIVTFDLKNATTSTVNTSEGSIKVLSLKDLIAMKKVSARPQDLEDIRALEQL